MASFAPLLRMRTRRKLNRVSELPSLPPRLPLPLPPAAGIASTNASLCTTHPHCSRQGRFRHPYSRVRAPRPPPPTIGPILSAGQSFPASCSTSRSPRVKLAPFLSRDTPYPLSPASKSTRHDRPTNLILASVRIFQPAALEASSVTKLAHLCLIECPVTTPTARV
ncbi:hypothetical protein BGZ57DRAFT_593086 [Hyaloscypha finlandica]|nr:hypothetical protein BGZ57DRAFT_593086 [Hyaloscypha finlandica]